MLFLLSLPSSLFLLPSPLFPLVPSFLSSAPSFAHLHSLFFLPSPLSPSFSPVSASSLSSLSPTPLYNFLFSLQTVVTERPSAMLHYNLVDCHVAICTPQMLVVFADNFDYQEMSHLIKGVMERDEVSEHDGTAARLCLRIIPATSQ